MTAREYYKKKFGKDPYEKGEVLMTVGEILDLQDEFLKVQTLVKESDIIDHVSNCDDIFEEASKCDIIEDECPKCGSNSVGVAFGKNECFDCQYEWA